MAGSARAARAAVVGSAAEAEEWRTSRHVDVGTTSNAEADVLVTDDFIAVGGRMKMATGLKHVEGGRASMQRAPKDSALESDLQEKVDAANAARKERSELQAGADLLNGSI